MSSSSSHHVFQDYSRLRSTLPTLRVEELKSVLRDINSIVDRAYARVTGRKDELVQRIEAYLQEAISQKSVKTYESIRTSIYRQTRDAHVSSMSYSHHSSQHINNNPNARIPPPAPTVPSNRTSAPTIEFGLTSFAPTTSLQSFHPKTDPVFGAVSTPGRIRPSYNNDSSSTVLPAFNSSLGLINVINPHSIPISFESSPFYRIDSAASTVAICQKAAQNDRKCVPLTITLTADQRARLVPSSTHRGEPQFQLRMFATSETYYNHPIYSPNLPSLGPAPTDYPLTSDIKLNNFTLTANLRGIKKQPGTAPPPDLGLIPGRNGTGQALDLREGFINRIDITYTNSEKRYFCVVYMVEYFGISRMLKNLKAGNIRSEEQVLDEIKKGSGDDDVMTSSSVLSLCDPVVLSRIKAPIRSMKCSHLQCFDAEVFYMMMEQTPTWLCPVCNVKIKNDDVTIDGYFERILKVVPSSIDSVVVESDGTWHDADYKYGTTPKPENKKTGLTVKRLESQQPSSPLQNKRDITVLELDSDDEQHGASNKRQRSSHHSHEPLVIDLTLDD